MENKMNEFLFTEKYRPQKIEDCILPDRLKKIFQEYVTKEEIPNLLLSGTAGVGKTTVALAMCEEIGLNYLFINSSEDRGIDMLRTKIMGYASTVSLTGGRKVIILDEADGLTPEAQDALRGAIEAFSSNCTFILTCNFKAKLKEAIHSRCSVIDFTLRKDEKPAMAGLFFKRLKEVLDKESITYDKNALAKIVEKFFPDYRRTLNEIQRFSVGGKLDIGVVAQISGITSLNDLAKFLKEKNFSEMRKWVAQNSDANYSSFYRLLYDNLKDILKPESIPQVVLILAKYQFQAAFVADNEINTVAMLTEIMIDGDFQ
jgi:replication factor C small subunit